MKARSGVFIGLLGRVVLKPQRAGHQEEKMQEGNVFEVKLSEKEQERRNRGESFSPVGRELKVARIVGHRTAEMIAMIDITRQDADRLVGNMVAVRTPDGIEVRWLDQEDGLYLLYPFHRGQTLSRLRQCGDGSIVGQVRWIGNAIVPGMRLAPMKTAPKTAAERLRGISRVDARSARGSSRKPKKARSVALVA